MKDRTLALAGLMQATELVRQAAWHGTWSGYAATTSLRSLFQLEADQVDTVYGGVSNLRLGLETLVTLLRGENRSADALRYSVGLLQIERQFVRAKGMQETVGRRLKEIEAEVDGASEDLEEHEREDRKAHAVAELYAETISTLTPRIVVNGRPQFLKRDRTVDWVRTLLLCGLRSAVLWDQLGGGRFELLFRRKRILSEATDLLYG